MKEVIIIAVVSLFSFQIMAQAFHPIEEREFNYFKLQTISEGVYVALAKNGATGCNTGIIDNGEFLTLFDPFFSEAPANELKSVLKKYFPNKSVRYVINSHWHGDHTKGNQYFKPEATIIGTEELRANMISHNDNKEEVAKWLNSDLKKYQSDFDTTSNDTYKREIEQYWLPSIEEELKSLQSFSLTPSDLIFHDSLRLIGKNFDIHVISYGRGHTVSDIIIWLPSSKIVFMGDLLFVKRHAWMGHGDYYDWQSYLKKVENKSPRWVVPAHGEIGGSIRITELHEYFLGIEKLASRFVIENEPFDKRKIAVPEKYKDYWWPEYYSLSVEQVYNEISKK